MAEFCARVEEEVGLRGLTVRFQARAGNGIVYSRFALPEDAPPAQFVSLLDWLRILVKKMHGYIVVEQIDPALKDRLDVWGPSGGAFALMKKLKDSFDPQQVLNPGRFVGGI